METTGSTTPSCSVIANHVVPHARVHTMIDTRSSHCVRGGDSAVAVVARCSALIAAPGGNMVVKSDKAKPQSFRHCGALTATHTRPTLNAWHRGVFGGGLGLESAVV